MKKKMIEEKKTEIDLYQEQIADFKKQVQSKDHELYKYKFKIKDLQKSKHVLTHKAKGIAASLEPKEKQIESLKEQILNLERVFEQHMKEANEREEAKTKMQSKIKQLTTELNQ